MSGIGTHMRWQKPRMRAQSALPPNANKHRQITRSFLKKVKQTFRSHARSCILQMPQEILHEIIRYLPLLYKAYLATSCRSMYNRIGTVLQDPCLQHPYSLHTNYPFIKQREIEAKIRTQLIRTVGENSYWKFCLCCEKLHLRSTWKKPAKKEREKQLCAGTTSSINCKVEVRHEYDLVPRNHRYYRKNYIPATMRVSKEECLPWAGVVEICPCLEMTYRYRDQLKDLLKSVGKNDPTCCAFNLENIFCRPSQGGKDTTLYHECTVREHPFVMAKIRTTFYLKNDYLRVHSNYHIYVPWGKLPVEVQPPIFTYSQQHLRRWSFRFSRFLKDPNSQDYGSFHDWRHFKRLKYGRRWDEFGFQIDRNLGKGMWPDTNWKKCRVPRSGGERW